MKNMNNIPPMRPPGTLTAGKGIQDYQTEDRFEEKLNPILYLTAAHTVGL
jgi:hypothetical protein